VETNGVNSFTGSGRRLLIMATRYIQTKFWDDGYIKNLNSNEKLIFIYLLTNPLTNIAGIYEISLERIYFDTKIKTDIVEKCFARFQQDKKIMYIEGTVFVINWQKHQSKSEKIEQGIKRTLLECKQSILQQFIDTLYIWYSPQENKVGYPIIYYTILNYTILKPNLDYTDNPIPYIQKEIVVYKKTVKKAKITFRESEYFDKQKFIAEFNSHNDYKDIDGEFYYEAVRNWAENGELRVNWISVARTFVQNDKRKNQIQFKNGTTQQRQKNGFGNNSKFGESEIERQRQIANELLAERGYQTIEPAGSNSDTGKAI